MGGVVDFVKDKVIDPVVDAGKKVIEITSDAIDLAIKTVTVTTEIVYDTVLKGESFKGSIADGINDLAKDIQDVYGSLLDDTLGIDDSKFLGFKGGFFADIGKIVNDTLNEHVTSTIGISIIVAAIVVSIFFPPAYGIATAVTTTAFSLGVTSTFGLMATWYASLAIVSLGLTVITSGLVDGAVLAMYGKNIFGQIYKYENAKETLRLVNLASTLDGTIYDRLAGGWMYNSQFAGGVYYDASNVRNSGICVGEEFSLSPHLVRTEFGFIDNTLKNLAGDSGFNVVTMTSNPK